MNFFFYLIHSELNPLINTRTHTIRNVTDFNHVYGSHRHIFLFFFFFLLLLLLLPLCSCDKISTSSRLMICENVNMFVSVCAQYTLTYNSERPTTSTITPPATAKTTTKRTRLRFCVREGDVYRYDFGINRANVVVFFIQKHEDIHICVWVNMNHGVYLWLCVYAYAFCCLHFCVCVSVFLCVWDSIAINHHHFFSGSQCHPTHALSILNYQFYCAYRPSNTHTHIST